MVKGSSPPFVDFGFDKSFKTSQYSYGTFAEALTGGTEFVQNSSFSLTRGFPIA